MHEARMAAQSRLRDFAAHYVRHQPAYRRLLLSSLAAYVIGSTYTSLNPKKKSKKAVGKETDAGKATTIAGGSAGVEETVVEGKGGRRKKKGPRVEVSRRIRLREEGEATHFVATFVHPARR